MLKALFSLAAAVPLAACAVAEPAAPTAEPEVVPARPNIVYIFTDQQFADAMSCAGNPHLKTPAMDRIAAQGVRFENAYCAYPLCVPSRMSMVTGRMPHEMGIFANVHASAKPLAFPSMGRIFQDAGYETSWIGKWHLTIPERNVREHGFKNVVFGGGYGDLDQRKAEAAEKFLRQRPDKPFLLVISFNNPHDCCELSRGDPLRMGPLPQRPSDDRLPPLPPNHAIPADEPDHLGVFAREYAKIFPARRWNEPQARRYLWGYYRLVEMVDREIGRVLDALAEAGLEENTVVVFASDHGDGATRHRWNQKFTLYDESAKVPFVVAWKGRTLAGHTEKRLVSAGLDLLPTLCDYAGIKPPAGLPGRSVRGLAEGRQPASWRDYVVTETSFSMWAKIGEDRWPKARMVRSERYKYIVYDTGQLREQLLDMENDPGEMVNLAGHPEHQEILARHRKSLREWCERAGDAFPHPSDEPSKP